MNPRGYQSNWLALAIIAVSIGDISIFNSVLEIVPEYARPTIEEAYRKRWANE